MAKFPIRALSVSGLRRRTDASVMQTSTKEPSPDDGDDPDDDAFQTTAQMVPEGMAVYYGHLGLAVGGLLCGMLHIIYCCQFYSSGVGVWNSLVLLAMGLRGFYLRKPPGVRLLVYAHAVILVCGIIVTALTSTGIHCATKGCSIYVKGVRARDQCAKQLIQLTHYSPQGLLDINLAILTLMLVIALMQILSAIHVIRIYIIDFFFIVKDTINAYYWLAALGLVTLCFGIAHTMMCCHLFYTGGGVWLSVVIMATGICGHRRMVSSVRVWRAIVCICVWAGFVLAGVGAFGIYCWRPVGSEPANDTKDVCREPPEWPNIYYHCYERLEVLGYWDPTMDPMMDSLRGSQVTFSFMLVLCGLSAGAGCMVILRNTMGHATQAGFGTLV